MNLEMILATGKRASMIKQFKLKILSDPALANYLKFKTFTKARNLLHLPIRNE